MSDKIFNRDEWTKALDGLRDSYKIFVPVRDGDFHSFKPLDEGITADFGYQNTRCSPKSLIFPQSERMFEYSLDGDNPDANILKETPKDYSPRAIVGIRPCDAHAFELVKINFDNPQDRDPWWVQRFESTVLVGLGCIEPCATCFCESVGGGPFDDKELDVLIYPLRETFLVRALTDDGKAFLAAAEGGSPADDSALRDAENLAASASDKISSKVATDKLKEKVVTKLFDAPFWEDVSFACINCGTCAYLCPTCWCFDIQDEVLKKEGDRIRNWDSCMFPLFTFHGSGHNPRDQKFKRVRQRFMHKLKYYVDKYGNGVQCSGCGRCIRYCPVNIDIRQVAALMNSL